MATVNDTKPTDIDLQDVIDAKSRQLRALLFNTYGVAGESFRTMSDDLQDAYMWACSDMADDILKSMDELGKRSMEKRSLREVQHG